MRKSFVWIATTLCGVVFAGVAHADNQVDQNGTSQHRASATTMDTPSGQTRIGSNQVPCPPHHVLTAAQRRQRAEAARRARDQRAAEEQARADELQRARDAEAAARNEAAQARNEITQARDAATQAENAANQARSEQAATQRALDAERMRRAQLAAMWQERERADAHHRAHRDVIARGGGPLHYRPLFTFGFDGGVAGFATDTTLRNSAYAGGTWGARVGLDFANWFGIEARYFGMANPLYAPTAGTGALLTNGVTGVMRLTIPTKWVQPYGFAGVGSYFTQTVRPIENQNMVTARNTNLAVPAGIGLNIPIGRVISVAAEGTYHALWDWDELRSSTTTTIHPDGIWSGTAVLRFRL